MHFSRKKLGRRRYGKDDGTLWKRIYDDGVHVEDQLISLPDDKLNAAQKSMALRLICKGKYKENELLRIAFRDDLSFGWALTRDSFCVGGTGENVIIKYSEITKIQGSYSGVQALTRASISYVNGGANNTTEEQEFTFKGFRGYVILYTLTRYLQVVTSLCPNPPYVKIL